MLKFLFIFTLSYFLQCNCEFAVVWKSDENSSKPMGYLWDNSDFVFVEPELVAEPVKELSETGKICGFEIDYKHRNLFVVSHESSGLAEIRVLALVDLRSFANKSQYHLSIQAYDCDIIRHYSAKQFLTIRLLNEIGVRFRKYEYRFNINEDSKLGSFVGQIDAIGTGIQYEIYGNHDIPFVIDKNNGKLYTAKSEPGRLRRGLLTLRVIAVERQTNGVRKRGIVTVLVSILPACVPKLSGIPNELDYDIPLTDAVDDLIKNMLIQTEEPIKIGMCKKLNESGDDRIIKTVVKVNILKSSQSALVNNHCYKLALPDFMKFLCGLHENLLSVQLENRTSKLFPTIISIKEEFSLLWWMKRNDFYRQNLFCLIDQESGNSISVSIVECSLHIANGNHTPIKIEIDKVLCTLHKWQHFSLIRKWDRVAPSFLLAINGEHVGLVQHTKQMFLRLHNVKTLIGSCVNVPNQLKHATTISSLLIHTTRALSMSTIKCLTNCQDTLFLLDDKSDDRQLIQSSGQSLTIESPNLLDVPRILKRIGYVNLNKMNKKRRLIVADVSIGLSIYYRDATPLLMPPSILRIVTLTHNNSPQLPSSILPGNHINETLDNRNVDTGLQSMFGVDIECSNNCQVISQSNTAIELLSNIQFVVIDSASQSIVHIRRNMLNRIILESCTLRPMERNFFTHERVYLPKSVKIKPLRVVASETWWSLEGKATASFYESILRQVRMDMLEQRRRLSLVCVMANDEMTSQIVVEVSLSEEHMKYSLVYSGEHKSGSIHHKSMDDRARRIEEITNNDNILSIPKPKFIAIIIMAVMGGATWSLVTIAISCFLLRRRSRPTNSRSGGKSKLISAAYPHLSKNTKSTILSDTFGNSDKCLFNNNNNSNSNHNNVMSSEEDRLSMADVPNCDDKHSIDGYQCDHCSQWLEDNEGDGELIDTCKDMIRRSNTINFPPLKDSKRY